MSGGQKLPGRCSACVTTRSADQEHQAKSNDADPGLNVKLSFDINEDVAAPFIAAGVRPKVAVLREQRRELAC